MKYKVIKAFTCKLDRKVRHAGDIYETDDPDRAKFLQGRGHLGAAIEEAPPEEPTIETEETPAETPAPELRHVGGGWYELPSGERVKGKEEAIAAMNGGD